MLQSYFIISGGLYKIPTKLQPFWKTELQASEPLCKAYLNNTLIGLNNTLVNLNNTTAGLQLA